MTSLLSTLKEAAENPIEFRDSDETYINERSVVEPAALKKLLAAYEVLKKNVEACSRGGAYCGCYQHAEEALKEAERILAADAAKES